MSARRPLEPIFQRHRGRPHYVCFTLIVCILHTLEALDATGPHALTHTDEISSASSYSCFHWLTLALPTHLPRASGHFPPPRRYTSLSLPLCYLSFRFPFSSFENRFFFIQYILIMVSSPQLLPDPSQLPIHPNLHPFLLTISLEYKQASSK